MEALAHRQKLSSNPKGHTVYTVMQCCTHFQRGLSRCTVILTAQQQ